MEKRTIIALILTAVIIFIFQIYFTPNQHPKPPNPPAKQIDKTVLEDKSKTEKQVHKASQDKKKAIELSPPKDIKIETPLFNITMVDLGAGIKSVKLKKYKETVKDNKPKEVIEDIKPYLYIPKLTISTPDGSVEDNINFKYDKNSLVINEKPDTITFTGTLSNGTKVKKSYTFYPDKYTFDFKLEIEGIDGNKVFIDFAMIGEKKTRVIILKAPLFITEKIRAD